MSGLSQFLTGISVFSSQRRHIIYPFVGSSACLSSLARPRRRSDANGLRPGRSHQWQPPSPLLVVHLAQGEEGAAAASPTPGRGDRLSGTCLWSWTTAPNDDGGSRVVHSGREHHRWPRLQWTRLHRGLVIAAPCRWNSAGEGKPSGCRQDYLTDGDFTPAIVGSA